LFVSLNFESFHEAQIFIFDVVYGSLHLSCNEAFAKLENHYKTFVSHNIVGDRSSNFDITVLLFKVGLLLDPVLVFAFFHFVRVA